MTRPDHNESLIDLIVERARLVPDHVAVICDRGQLTYRELDERSDRLACVLLEHGAAPETRVGLCLGRSLDLAVALLAVLKTGACVVPVDPSLPPARQRFLLEDAGVAFAVVDGARPVAGQWPGRRIGVSSWPSASSRPVHAPWAADQACAMFYTSGSGGLPKAVVLTHDGLLHHSTWHARAAQLAPTDRVLQFVSIGFDAFLEDLLPTWIAGASVVMRPDVLFGSARAMMRWLGDRAITVLDLPTAYWAQLVGELAADPVALPSSVRLWIVSGDRCDAASLARWHTIGGGAAAWWNLYGPTESTQICTRFELAARAALPTGEVPIGRAIDDTQIHIVDSRLRTVAVGEVGEICVSGRGVARGYWGRPGLTARVFVPDPFSTRPGARMYRTGDLGRWRADGELEFIGRVDHQIKLRGMRIEPGEIEAKLRRHRAVREVAVRPIRRGADDLLAAFVVFAGEPVPWSELRVHIAKHLPEVMVPRAWHRLDALPLSANGKVDRRALALPADDESALTPELAPRTPTEWAVADIWSSLFGVPVSRDASFFELGGDSLLAMQVTARVRSRLGVEVALSDLFDAATLADFARAIDDCGRAGPLVAGRMIPPLTPRTDRDAVAPLTAAQARAGNLADNSEVLIRFEGALDVVALEAALSEIVRRHESLRTTFPGTDGTPVQVVHPPYRVQLPVEDLTGVPEVERETALERRVAEELARSFDVTALPPMSWRVFRLGPTSHAYLQVEHRFVHDGWSVGVFLRELRALYDAYQRDRPSPLPELAVQLGDFAAWHRRWVDGPAGDAQLAYWRTQLTPMPPSLELPTDFPRPQAQRYRGAVENLEVPESLYRELADMAHREGMTTYMVLLAAFYVLLHRTTGQDDLVVGSVMANRRSEEAEALIGTILNTVALRANLSGSPDVRTLLRSVRQVCLGALENQDVPFDRVLDALQLPLVKVLFSSHDSPVPDLKFGEAQGRFTHRHNGLAKADLNVIVNGTALTWEFDADLFLRDSVRRLADHYLAIVRAIVRSPQARIADLPLPERAEAVTSGRGAAAASASRCRAPAADRTTPQDW